MGKIALSSAKKGKNNNKLETPPPTLRKTRTSRSDPSESDTPRRSLRPLRRRRQDSDYDAEESDSQCERQNKKEKKVKLFLKVQQNEGSAAPSDRRTGFGSLRTSRRNAAPASSSSFGCENGNKPLKKRKIHDDDVDVDDDDDDDDDMDDVRSNRSGDDDDDGDCKEKKPNGIRKENDSVAGMPSESAAGTPLPEKKELELILDKLQKKDTYGVFAEPVDPEELPDYHDVIEHPMDFGTIRKKLANGTYSSLEQFESDVFLICTNAMQYNAPDTIYFRQARSIQDLARKKFEKLKVDGIATEVDLTSTQRTRSPLVAKSLKKSLGRTTQEPVGSDYSSGATLATTGDTCTRPNTTQSGHEKPANVDDSVIGGNSFLVENKQEQAEELPAKGLPLKSGKKLSVLDENRRATYNMASQPAVGNESSFAAFESEMKQLVAVGLHADHSYARSLARFAATLGPVAWKVASRRIEQALPAGYKFGRGWVGEYEPLPTSVLSFENHKQIQLSGNAHMQGKAELKKNENGEKLKAVQDGSHNSVKLGVTTTLNLPVETASSWRPDLPKEGIFGGAISEGKPGSFGVVAGTKSTANGMYKQQNDTLTMNVGKPNSTLLKDVVASHTSSVKTATETASRSEATTSGLLEMASRSRSPVFPVAHRKQDAVGLHPKHNVSRSGNSSMNMEGLVVTRGLPDARALGSLPSNGAVANSLNFLTNHQMGASFYSSRVNSEQSLNDPVEVMRMLAEMQNQPKTSNTVIADGSQVTSSLQSSWRNDSSAATNAARAWMSMGPSVQQVKLKDSSGVKQMQIAAASLYNPSRETPAVSPACETGPGSGSMPSEKNRCSQQPGHAGLSCEGAPVSGFMQSEKSRFAQQLERNGKESQFQSSRPMVFPQQAVNDLSRFRVQPPWQGLVPHNQHMPKKDMLPPDLNIVFQSPESPVPQSSGVLVDSQQPDLALQL